MIHNPTHTQIADGPTTYIIKPGKEPEYVEMALKCLK